VIKTTKPKPLGHTYLIAKWNDRKHKILYLFHGIHNSPSEVQFIQLERI
jgi:hypothetical protein